MPSLTRWQEQIQAVRDTWGLLDWWDAPAGAEREWFARDARASVTPGWLAAELTSYLHTDIGASRRWSTCGPVVRGSAPCCWWAASRCK